jgi:hypothetical protein
MMEHAFLLYPLGLSIVAAVYLLALVIIVRGRA